MSLDIWMRCEGPSRVARLAVQAWRVVEAQHKVSTRKLVDTLDEQSILEDIVDEVKPPMPTGGAFDGLHYLLSTPFGILRSDIAIASEHPAKEAFGMELEG